MHSNGVDETFCLTNVQLQLTACWQFALADYVTEKLG